MNLDAYYRIKEEIGENVRLIAVSKKQPLEKIIELHRIGHLDFGENYVQELQRRNTELLGMQLNWHLIGHLQSNKVKYIAPFITMIQSVDSLNLLKIINKEAEKNNRVIDCLLQIYIATEESKFGLDESECYELLQNEEFYLLKNIRIRGLMGMASFTSDTNLVKKEFRHLKRIYDKIKSEYCSGNTDFNTLSMGMSDDYKIAIDEGSTMVRIGSLIFGQRTY